MCAVSNSAGVRTSRTVTASGRSNQPRTVAASTWSGLQGGHRISFERVGAGGWRAAVSACVGRVARGGVGAVGGVVVLQAGGGGVAVVVVDQHDLPAGAVEDRGGDRRRGSPSRSRPTPRRREPRRGGRRSSCSGMCCEPATCAGGAFVVAAGVEDLHRPGCHGRGEPGEVGDRVGAQRLPVGEGRRCRRSRRRRARRCRSGPARGGRRRPARRSPRSASAACPSGRASPGR